MPIKRGDITVREGVMEWNHLAAPFIQSMRNLRSRSCMLFLHLFMPPPSELLCCLAQVHNERVVHGSGPNLSDGWRKVRAV